MHSHCQALKMCIGLCKTIDRQFSLHFTSLMKEHFRLEESLIDMFKNEGQLEDGKLRKTHEIVKSLLDSDFSAIVYDRLKVFTGNLSNYAQNFHFLQSQLLPKAMTVLKSKLGEDELDLLVLESIWQVFHQSILPTMQCMLYMIEVYSLFDYALLMLMPLFLQTPKTISIRKAAIIAFRDYILLSVSLEGNVIHLK